MWFGINYLTSLTLTFLILKTETKWLSPRATVNIRDGQGEEVEIPTDAQSKWHQGGFIPGGSSLRPLLPWAPGTLWTTTQCSWEKLFLKLSQSNHGGASLWNTHLWHSENVLQDYCAWKRHLLDLAHCYSCGPANWIIGASLSLFFLPSGVTISQSYRSCLLKPAQVYSPPLTQQHHQSLTAAFLPHHPPTLSCFVL